MPWPSFTGLILSDYTDLYILLLEYSEAAMSRWDFKPFHQTTDNQVTALRFVLCGFNGCYVMYSTNESGK